MLQTFDSAPIGKFHIFSRVELSMISSGSVLLNDGVFRQTLRVQLGMQFAANTGGQTPRNGVIGMWPTILQPNHGRAFEGLSVISTNFVPVHSHTRSTHQ